MNFANRKVYIPLFRSNNMTYETISDEIERDLIIVNNVLGNGINLKLREDTDRKKKFLSVLGYSKPVLDKMNPVPIGVEAKSLYEFAEWRLRNGKTA